MLISLSFAAKLGPEAEILDPCVGVHESQKHCSPMLYLYEKYVEKHYLEKISELAWAIKPASSLPI